MCRYQRSMKIIHHLPIAIALAALAPSACTSSFPAGIDYSASGGTGLSGGGGGDSGRGGSADAAGVATGGAPATGGVAGAIGADSGGASSAGGIAGVGTGGVAGAIGADSGGAPATGGSAGGTGVSAAGGVPAVGGTATVGAGGVGGAVAFDASLDGPTACVPSGRSSPLAMLPTSNEIGTWALSAAPAAINQEADFYAKIDGAAVGYIDRGWVRSAYATYQQRGSSIDVAVHDMGTPDNAQTIFQVKLPVSRIQISGLSNAVVDTGVYGAYSAYAWSGQYLIEVSMYERSDSALGHVETFVLDILNRGCAVGTDAGAAPDAPPATPAFTSVTAQYGAACGLRTDGTIACWGSHAPAAPPTGDFTSVSLGGWPCAVRADTTALCWDPSSGDVFGTGADGGTMVGFATPPGSYLAVSVGYAGVCGLLFDGTVTCWGPCSNVELPPAGRFASISFGSSWACGVKSDGTVACWNECSAPGIPQAPDGKYISVSVGVNAACGVKDDGTLACWGNGAATSPPAGTFLSVSTGSDYACGVKTDGTLACWGDNSYGRATPPSGTFASISAGYEFGCGVRSNGSLACWGNNASGEATPPAH